MAVDFWILKFGIYISNEWWSRNKKFSMYLSFKKFIISNAERLVDYISPLGAYSLLDNFFTELFYQGIFWFLWFTHFLQLIMQNVEIWRQIGVLICSEFGLFCKINNSEWLRPTWGTLTLKPDPKFDLKIIIIKFFFFNVEKFGLLCRQ